MRPKWPKLASLAQKICTIWFQFFGPFFAYKDYPFKNIIIQTEINHSNQIYNFVEGTRKFCVTNETEVL